LDRTLGSVQTSMPTIHAFLRISATRTRWSGSGSSMRRRIGLHARGERFWTVVGYDAALCLTRSSFSMRSQSGCVRAAGRGTFMITCWALVHSVAYAE